MRIRTLKRRVCIKQLIGIYHEATAEYRAFAEACAPEGAWMREEIDAFPGTIPTLALVAASSLGYTPEELRAWGLL